MTRSNPYTWTYSYDDREYSEGSPSSAFEPYRGQNDDILPRGRRRPHPMRPGEFIYEYAPPGERLNLSKTPSK